MSITASPRNMLTFVSANLLLFFSGIFTGFANPVLENIPSGDVHVSQTSRTTQVLQNSQQAILNWKSFNINYNEHTHFQQPAGGIALNRINPSQGASQIYGALTATGQIILVNPAGIHLNSHAYVNVGGLIASTSDISNENFLNRQYVFDQPSTLNGKIINNGVIKAADYGLVALLADNVQNNGLIRANFGTVVLGSGSKFTLNFAGDQLVNFVVDAPAANAKISNAGYVSADGGRIILSAKTAQQVLDRTINMTGVLEARSIGQRQGEIILLANEGSIDISGRISATGEAKGTVGGNIQILSKYINLTSSCSLIPISVSGDAGGGNILLAAQNEMGDIQNASLITMRGGQLNASSFSSGRAGNITLRGDYIYLAGGDINARGMGMGTYGGVINIFGHHIKLDTGMHINANSDLGESRINIGRENTTNTAAPSPDSFEMARGSVIEASAYSKDGFGGQIRVGLDYTVIDGKIIAADKNVGGFGGAIEVVGETIKLGSTALIDANGNAGGGRIIIGQNPLISTTTNAIIDIARGSLITATASGVAGSGGSITIFGKNTTVSGKLDTSAKFADGFGGNINILASNNLLLKGATVDASGHSGGGRILIGGNFFGSGIEPPAVTTTVDANTVINASALTNGAGGNIVVWANDTTNFAGKIYARGGAVGGDGGFVQIGAGNHLNFTGTADVSAPHGTPGTVVTSP